MPNFGLLQEDCMAGLPEAAFCLLAQWHASVHSCTYSTSNTSAHQYIHYTVANTVAVIRGSYNGLPSTSTCQLTTCHRRCEVETKAASSTSIEHLCIFVLSSSDVCIVEQRREAGAFLRGVPTNKQQSHPLWRLAQSWGTLFKKVNRSLFLRWRVYPLILYLFLPTPNYGEQSHNILYVIHDICRL